MNASPLIIAVLLASSLTLGVLYYKRVELKTCWQEVPCTEDLMREHGILNRVLRIYEKVEDQISKKEKVDYQLVIDAAIIVRDFIHEYHEKLEEKHLFTIFEKKGLPLAQLTQVLREQHAAGGKVTYMIIHRAGIARTDNNSENIQKLAADLKGFVGMYRPHENREDTELFPAVRAQVTAEEYNRLTDIFEDTENEKFGKHAYEKMVNRVAEMERKLGIYEIAQYTPHAE